MIVEELLTLPPWIDFEGINFELSLFSNGPELRLAYVIRSVDDDSPHKDGYEQDGCWTNKIVDAVDPPSQSFLMLYEGIQTDVDLCWAARQMWYWLAANGFHDLVYTKQK